MQERQRGEPSLNKRKEGLGSGISVEGWDLARISDSPPFKRERRQSLWAQLHLGEGTGVSWCNSSDCFRFLGELRDLGFHGQ